MGLSCALGPAQALVLPKGAGEKLARRYDAFVAADGFRRVDPSALEDALYTRQHFPDPDTTTACGSSAGINDATIALMLVAAHEPALPHRRYRITYRLEQARDLGGVTAAYVEVTRFNLGPVLHAEAEAAAPEGVPVAPPEQFGVGPSVRWRFVMRWAQCRMVYAVRASRRVLRTAQARAVDCLGVSCLASTDPAGPAGDWQQIRPPPMKSAPYVVMHNGVATAARVSEYLYRQASGGKPTVAPLYTHSDPPQLTFVISMNVEGQDHTADGLLHQSLLRDDAISDIWTRRRDAGGDTVDWREHIGYQAGRH